MGGRGDKIRRRGIGVPDPVGTIRVRTRYSNGEQRHVIKTEHGWQLLARYVWETQVGPIPPGHIVHHLNEDTLDDRRENLEPVTRSEHVRLHRPHTHRTPSAPALAGVTLQG